jgi:iron(II)-dependent oxidoreductase
MGSDSDEEGFEDAKPSREVTVPSFEMSKTAVTVQQYAECVAKDECTEPATGGRSCNWGVPGRQLHPVNCVDWDQAQQYARFKDARLPSEAEWEYAARSGGKNQKYPWGDDEPTCDKAVMYGNGGDGCGKKTTMPVCSKPSGNTAQGLCDMAGNVWQWVQDTYQDSYKEAPVDASATYCAFEGCDRVLRGGCFSNNYTRNMRVDIRYNFDPSATNDTFGFRLARSSR